MSAKKLELSHRSAAPFFAAALGLCSCVLAAVSLSFNMTLLTFSETSVAFDPLMLPGALIFVAVCLGAANRPWLLVFGAAAMPVVYLYHLITMLLGGAALVDIASAPEFAIFLMSLAAATLFSIYMTGAVSDPVTVGVVLTALAAISLALSLFMLPPFAERESATLSFSKLIMFVTYLLALLTAASAVRPAIGKDASDGARDMPDEPLFTDVPKAMLWSALTLGIYYVVWGVRFSGRLSKMSGKGGASEFLAAAFVPFYAPIWAASRARTLKIVAAKRGTVLRDRSVECMLLSVFPFNIAMLAVLQHDMNKLAKKPAAVEKQISGKGLSAKNPAGRLLLSAVTLGVGYFVWQTRAYSDADGTSGGGKRFAEALGVTFVPFFAVFSLYRRAEALNERFGADVVEDRASAIAALSFFGLAPIAFALYQCMLNDASDVEIKTVADVEITADTAPKKIVADAKDVAPEPDAEPTGIETPRKKRERELRKRERDARDRELAIQRANRENETSGGVASGELELLRKRDMDWRAYCMARDEQLAALSEQLAVLQGIALEQQRTIDELTMVNMAAEQAAISAQQTADLAQQQSCAMQQQAELLGQIAYMQQMMDMQRRGGV